MTNIKKPSTVQQFLYISLRENPNPFNITNVEKYMRDKR